MNQLKIFINLTRLNKPIGFMLLFWPCSWGIVYAFQKNQDFKEFIFLITLFFLGSVLMRSAGCIFNDIIDKDFDKKVERTKFRPIASGQISIQKSFLYIILLCSLAFVILIQLNFLTILLGLGSMFFAFSYPFMKRFTYWPQLFLGLTFNWGIIMGWTAMTDQISYEIVILYVSAIFWTLGYDTIYGIQDVEDDEIIGIKSTAIKFKKNIKFFVSICYLITSLAIIYLFYKNLGVNLTTLFLAMFILSLIYQVIFFNKNNPNSCLKAFKLNNYSGMFLFFSFLFG
tara:strand:+ start:1247 stop:2101 length:855 start_codon:yes stop_codon:yes gene_type:complete